MYLTIYETEVRRESVFQPSPWYPLRQNRTYQVYLVISVYSGSGRNELFGLRVS